MRIIVTEAAQPLGSHLVQHLMQQGHHLLLVGSDPAQLSALYPAQPNSDYRSVSAETLRNFDACIHLEAHKLAAPQNDTENRSHSILTSFCNQLYDARVKQQICISPVSSAAAAPFNISETEHVPQPILKAFNRNLVDRHLTILHIGQIQTVNKSHKSALAAMIQATFRPAISRKIVMNAIDQALISPTNINPTSITLTDKQADNYFYILIRWIVDHIFVFTVLCFSWLFPILYILVKLDSPGPVIFSQQRVGKNGKLFMCYKFRSMQVGTQNVPTHELPPLAVTKMGNFFRTTKLDELPQIWNILRGEMTLIGPRPCLPTQDELLSNRRTMGVLDVLPGLTGFAQVNKIDMSDPHLLAATDKDYIDRRTLLLDLKIAIKTAFG